jgi:hypothetical protein
MGKDKRTYKKVKEITEPIFNLAAYNCCRNFTFDGKNSKRAAISMAVITTYMGNIGQKNK